MKPLFALLFLLFASAVSAQTLFTFGTTTDPEDLQTQLDGLNEVGINATVKNNSTDTLNLTWVREEVTMPSGWTSTVCDLKFCYLSHVSTQTFPIAPNVSSNGFSVHVQPADDTSAMAVVKIDMFVQGDTTTKQTINFIYSKTVANHTVAIPATGIYPNPALSYFRVQGSDTRIARLQIYNVLGVKVADEAFTGSRVDVSSLNPGMYFVRLLDKQNRVLVTYRLRKN